MTTHRGQPRDEHGHPLTNIISMDTIPSHRHLHMINKQPYDVRSLSKLVQHAHAQRKTPLVPHTRNPINAHHQFQILHDARAVGHRPGAAYVPVMKRAGYEPVAHVGRIIKGRIRIAKPAGAGFPRVVSHSSEGESYEYSPTIRMSDMHKMKLGHVHEGRIYMTRDQQRRAHEYASTKGNAITKANARSMDAFVERKYDDQQAARSERAAHVRPGGMAWFDLKNHTYDFWDPKSSKDVDDLDYAMIDRNLRIRRRYLDRHRRRYDDRAQKRQMVRAELQKRQR